MYSTIVSSSPANDAFVDQFRGYAERWMKRMQSQGESQGAGSDAKGPGRPRELPDAALWSSLLLCVLDRAQGVRDLWRALVCQGYDICDQAVYARGRSRCKHSLSSSRRCCQPGYNHCWTHKHGNPWRPIHLT